MRFNELTKRLTEFGLIKYLIDTLENLETKWKDLNTVAKEKVIKNEKKATT
jgi:hypothetical protein